MQADSANWRIILRRVWNRWCVPARILVYRANTPHLVFDEVQRRTAIPLLSIVRVTADHAKRLRLKKFGRISPANVVATPNIILYLAWQVPWQIMELAINGGKLLNGTCWRCMKLLVWFVVFSGSVIGQVPHQHHPPSSEEYAKVLDDPSRNEWQKPHDVVMALNLKPAETIADIGAGTGYFARRFANHAGKVYAVDIDEKLLAIAGENAPSNLKTVVAAPEDPRLPTHSVDTIFFCDVLHHIADRPAYYAKVAEALKPGGRVVVIDFYEKPLPVGPPPSMKLSDKAVIKEWQNAGFKLNKRLNILPYQYFLFFSKR
jgi:arsenite methyltransferase